MSRRKSGELQEQELEMRHTQSELRCAELEAQVAEAIKSGSDTSELDKEMKYWLDL